MPGPRSSLLPRRLPGVRFEAPSRPATDILPRMDVAGFVGFAVTGPLDVPVAVEDMTQFSEVFGPPAPLFWDPVSGERVTANLASAVRAFFANGGQRCWVVRVAARRRLTRAERRPGESALTSQAARARLPLPGLAWTGADGVPAQAELRARAAGSWADDLVVSAGLLASPLVLVPGSVWAGSGAAGCLLRGRDPVRPGDLVRARFPEDALELLFVVATVAPAAASPPDAGEVVAVTGAQPLWLATSALGTSPLTGPVTATATVEGSAGPVAATVEDQDAGGPGAGTAADRDAGAAVRAELRLPIAAAPAAGTLVRLDLQRVDLGPALLLVEQARAGDPPSAPAGPSSILTGHLYRPSAAPPPGAPPAGPAVGQLLTLEVRARMGQGRLQALGPLGFSPGHPRHAGALPTDEQLYEELLDVDEPLPRPSEALAEAAASPRFPLAGLGARTLYPIGLDTVGGRVFTRARRDPRPALVRDGLDRFEAALFLDPDLAASGTATTLETAEFLRYRSDDPRDLVGIHSLLGVEEVSLVAVPDAVHQPWSPVPPAPVPFPPEPEPSPEPDDCGPADRSAAGFQDCLAVAVPAPRWQLPTPTPGEPLHARADRLGNLRLAWDPVAGAGVYAVEAAAHPWSWDGAQEVHQGAQTFLELRGLTHGAHFYRVRALAGDRVGDWSEGVTVTVATDEPWTGHPASPDPDPDPYGTLLAVQRALVRMCAARGDLQAVLSAPRRHREREVVDHVARLRGSEPVAGLDMAAAVLPLAGEERALSFGALYHPWTVTGDEDQPGELVEVPPDGAAAGVLARRALARGAWVAPANELLEGVVALVPGLPAASRQLLQDGRVNTVRQEPAGFLWLSADTLSDDPDLRQVSVRRLLSLLRRVALRHGPTYVFEANDEALRRRLRRGFEAVLTDLLGRGAFAGTTPEESFQVVTAAPAATPQAVEEGRLVVELKVAPSIPMRFLTVRLINVGDTLRTEGG